MKEDTGDEIIADLGETDGPEVDLKDWSTDVLKAEKLLETKNDDIEVET